MRAHRDLDEESAVRISHPTRSCFTIIFLVWVIARASALGAPQRDPGAVREIGTVELRNRMKIETMTLVDMRPAQEFRILHIWGATNLPPHQTDEIARRLPHAKDIPVVFYGLDAPDSLMRLVAQTATRELGYEETYVYQDGFRQWRWYGYFLSGRGLHTYLSRRKGAPRDRVDRPEDIMNALGVAPGSRVADVGAGYGYFTLHLSRRVGNTGTVFAVEIIGAYVEQLKERIAQAGASNVRVILGDIDNPHLPEDRLNGILVFDTYHEMTDFQDMLFHMRESLKEGGRLLIVDYEPGKTGQLRKTSAAHHTISADTVIVDVRQAGFTLVQREDEFISGHKRGSMFHLLFKK